MRNNPLAVAVAVLAGLIGVLAVFLLAPLVGVTIGAFAGWVVGHVFPGTIGIIGSLITGGATIPAWQVGAILGFVGGFFKTRVFSKTDD